MRKRKKRKKKDSKKMDQTRAFRYALLAIAGVIVAVSAFTYLTGS